MTPSVSQNRTSDSRAAARLLSAVVIKTMLEVIFVCIIVTLAAMANFHPFLRGAIDIADGSRIAGWARDPSSPDEGVQVQLFIDGDFVASMRANEPRPDLVTAGAANRPNHGFAFSIESLRLAPGHHIVKVYAVREALGRNMIMVPITKQPVSLEIR